MQTIRISTGDDDSPSPKEVAKRVAAIGERVELNYRGAKVLVTHDGSGAPVGIKTHDETACWLYPTEAAHLSKVLKHLSRIERENT